MESKTKYNADCRAYAQKKGVCLWQVAEMLGYSCDSSFSRKMRRELSEADKSAFMRAVDTIAKEQNGQNEKKS